MTWQPLRTGPEEREPRPVADSLANTAKRLGVPSVGVLGAIFTHWDELVGPEVAAHATPRSLRAGVLTIEVDQPAWATQLRFLSAEVLARLTDAAGPEGVSELQITVAGPPTSPTRWRGGGRRRGPGEKPLPDTPLW